MGKQHDLPIVRPVDDAGRFDPLVREVGGREVDADAALIGMLEDRGLLSVPRRSATATRTAGNVTVH